MEVKEVNFKRFVPSEGKALRWKVVSWDYRERKPTECYKWSPYAATIDMSEVIGEVEEIPYSEFATCTSHCCFLEKG